jgi:FtsP/CotA-like multicopper oxidase with cupredoxin domain
MTSRPAVVGPKGPPAHEPSEFGLVGHMRAPFTVDGLGLAWQQKGQHEDTKEGTGLPPDGLRRRAGQVQPDGRSAQPYMLHCHLLRHEDNGMMGQFVVVNPGPQASKPPSHQHR